MPNYQSRIIAASMTTIRNLPKEASVSQKKGRNGTVPKESLLNRCLTQIERISKQIPSSYRISHQPWVKASIGDQGSGKFTWRT